MTQKKNKPEPQTTKEDITKAPSKVPVYILSVLFLVLLGYAAYDSHLKNIPFPSPNTHLGKGLPLDNMPKTQVEILDNQPEEEIVDITTNLQQFPQREIPETAITEVIPTPEEIAAAETQASEIIAEAEEAMPAITQDIANAAQLAQATLTLAKQHTQYQANLAQLHTMIALIQNPTQSTEEQQTWAKLAIPVAQKLNATMLADALTAFTTPTPQIKEPQEEPLPLWLSPFKGLIKIHKSDQKPQPELNPLQPVLKAYQQFVESL